MWAKIKGIVINNYKSAIATIIFLLLVGAGNAGCLLVDKYYNEIYDNNFEMNIGVADFAEFDGISSVDPKLKGDWEFYFNKWLITDGIERGTPDGYLTPYERWSDLIVNGEKLPTTGYGSYRVILENIPPNRILSVRTYDCSVPWKAYVNGVLVSSYGEGLCKNPKDNKIYNGVVHSNDTVITEEGMTYELIVELSASTDGGQNAPTTVAFRDPGKRETFSYTLAVFVGLTLGVLLLVLILVLTYAFSFRSDKTHIAFALLVILIILSYFFSYDAFRFRMLLFPKFNNAYIPDITFWTSIVTYITIFFYLMCVNKFTFSHKGTIIVVLTLLLFTIPTTLTHGMKAQYWVYAASLSISIGLIVFFMSKGFNKNTFENCVYLGILFLMTMFYMLQGMDTLNAILWGAAKGYSILILLITIAATLLYLRRSIINNKKLMQMIKKDAENQYIRTQVLKAQIKPHFVFNTLTLIKDNYHKSTKKGDTALDMFAKHLRTNLEADMNDVIPFSAEIDNIINYFDLENMKFDGKLSLLLDIEYDSFSIPPLSLQPIVENSLKYSGIQNMEDGFISLLSKEEDGNIIIEIEDNGDGFDQNVKKPNSVGLKNISERLKFILGATLKIESTVGIGTKTTLIIPKKREEK